MAPSKFGLFKTRSREQPEQPSTENLLSYSQSNEQLHHPLPSSPLPSTSQGVTEGLTPADILALRLDSDEEDVVSEKLTPRRFSKTNSMEDNYLNYKPLKNQTSIEGTSTSTLHDDYDDELTHNDDDTTAPIDDNDGASTSYDAKSLQLDDVPVETEKIQRCSIPKRPRVKKYKTRKEEKLEREKELWEEQYMKDYYMWRATNFEVTQNLLRRSYTLDEKIKWEAIATARGLCTLTDSCTCKDCKRRVNLAGITDGDAGLGAAQVLGSFTPGCVVQ